MFMENLFNSLNDLTLISSSDDEINFKENETIFFSLLEIFDDFIEKYNLQDNDFKLCVEKLGIMKSNEEKKKILIEKFILKIRLLADNFIDFYDDFKEIALENSKLDELLRKKKKRIINLEEENDSLINDFNELLEKYKQMRVQKKQFKLQLHELQLKHESLETRFLDYKTRYENMYIEYENLKSDFLELSDDYLSKI